jgi:pyroglutamyl-peptidase
MNRRGGHWFTFAMKERKDELMKSVLLTGFEPFGGEEVNPSARVVEKLDGRFVGGRLVIGTVLPVVFGKSLAMLKLEVRRVQPEWVLCLGQAGGRAEISLERVALNIQDANIPDNAGNQPVDRPVVRGGPAAYWSTLPIKSVVAAIREAGIPAGVSESAGTFVCNQVFYGLMWMLEGQRKVRGGFIHVPYLPEQARRLGGGAPSLPLKRMVRGIEIAIETLSG